MPSAAPAGEVYVYGYRWVVLGVWMLCNTLLPGLWICYAPVANRAASLWDVSEVQVGLLAMTFMYIYVPTSLPASWALERFGYRRSVGFAVVVMALAALVRGVFALNYTLVLAGTVALAAIQPLVVNASTKLVARWFPSRERATVVGLAFVAPVLGVALGSGLTPILVDSLGFAPTYRAYAAAAVIAAVLFLIFSREQPPTPAGFEPRVTIGEGFGVVLRKPAFYLLGAAFFLAFAIWDGVATWVEGITRARGFSPAQVGAIGGLLSLAGILGALALPWLSDRLRRRRAVLIGALVLCLPGLAGLTLLSTFGLVAAATVWLGVFIVGCIPLISQYAVELCYPAPETASTGVLMIASQGSVLAITLMGWIYTQIGSFTPSLLTLAALVLVVSFVLLRVRESPAVQRPR
jgi:cyanate permease